MLKKSHPATAKLIMDRAQNHVWTRWGILKAKAAITYPENPFETGAVDEAYLAVATGQNLAADVVGMPKGNNCPIACEVKPSKDVGVG
jgi:hypothetical protein